MLTSQRGFTLIELVMLIVLLGVVSVTALPKFFNYQVFQERGFFDDTLAAFRYAQKLAIATGCNVLITTSGNQFQLKRPAASDRSKCSSTTSSDFTLNVTRPGSIDSYQGSQSGIAITSASIFFTAKGGSASGDSSITVGSRSFNIVAATGFIHENP